MWFRELQEARERRTFAVHALFSGDSRGRRHAEPEDPYRTVYQRDRDRIIHCTAFRRLEYKTQVFAYHEGDYYRTRLTHSIEVSQIARSIACALGLNETFCEALSLAHDLGHPPFGHAGGEVLHEKMRHHGGFEHNVQGLRIVDQLERRYPHFRGLNLSFELREAILKHGPTGADAQTEEFTPMRKPLLETVVVDLADSTAYNHHDLDDGLRSGILDFDELCRDVELARECLDAAREHCGNDATPRDLRLATIGGIVKRSIQDLVQSSAGRLECAAPKDASEAREQEGLIGFSEGMARRQEQLQDFLFTRFYRHFRVERMMHKAKRMLGDLFDTYVDHKELMPPEFVGWSEQVGVHRAVCDYLAGMTDRYTEQEHRKIFDPRERV